MPGFQKHGIDVRNVLKAVDVPLDQLAQLVEGGRERSSADRSSRATSRCVPLLSRITPPKLADMLERDNREVLQLIANIDTRGNASLQYEVADIKVLANLGLHLAEKSLRRLARRRPRHRH